MFDSVAWSAAQDARLRRLRLDGSTWNAIALELGRTRWTVIERARRIGAPGGPPQPPPRLAADIGDERLALPAGHPRSWRAITDRTLLHDEPYPLPVFCEDLSEYRNKT
jgi:hypothetical protein